MPEVVGCMAHCLMQEQVEGNPSLVLSPLLGYSALYTPRQQLTGTSQWSCHPTGKTPPLLPVLEQIHWLQCCRYCQEMGYIQCCSSGLGWLGGGTHLAQQVPQLGLALQVPQPWGVWAGHVHNDVVSQRAQRPNPSHVVSCSVSRALVLAQVYSKRHSSWNTDTVEPGQQDQPPSNSQST